MNTKPTKMVRTEAETDHLRARVVQTILGPLASSAEVATVLRQHASSLAKKRKKK